MIKSDFFVKIYLVLVFIFYTLSIYHVLWIISTWNENERQKETRTVEIIIYFTYTVSYVYSIARNITYNI